METTNRNDINENTLKPDEIVCPKCGAIATAEHVDNGFGQYAVQVEPYHCSKCNWAEDYLIHACDNCGKKNYSQHFYTKQLCYNCYYGYEKKDSRK